jgi:hypothetical protein
MIGIIQESLTRRTYARSTYAAALAEAKHRTKERPGLTLAVGGRGSRGEYNIRMVSEGRISCVLNDGFKADVYNNLQ